MFKRLLIVLCSWSFHRNFARSWPSRLSEMNWNWWWRYVWPANLLLSFQLVVQGNPGRVMVFSVWISVLSSTSFASKISLLCFLHAEDHEVHLLKIDNKPVLPVRLQQWTVCFYGCSNVLAATYKVVPSACMFTKLHLKACRKLFISSTNIIGPRMDYCGTPYLGVHACDEMTCSACTLWHLIGTTLLLFPQHQSRAEFFIYLFIFAGAHGQSCQMP